MRVVYVYAYAMYILLLKCCIKTNLRLYIIMYRIILYYPYYNIYYIAEKTSQRLKYT